MLWPTLKSKAADERLPLHTVIAEVLHLAILEGLFSGSESTALNFQGGTSIHLLYGGYRFSEDLDFAGEALTWNAASALLTNAQSEIEKQVTQTLGIGEHGWKLPAAGKKRRLFVVWYSFRPLAQRQKYRVKLEFAHYPVYEPLTLPVQSEFDVRQRRLLITGLSQQELLAEKLTAVFGRKFVKGRDLFDLWYFREVLGVTIAAEILQRKLIDYNVAIQRKDIRTKLQQYAEAALESEMQKFLPVKYRRLLEKNGYRVIRSSAKKAVSTALQAL